MAFWGNYLLNKWDEFSTNYRSRHTYDMTNHLRNILLPKFRSETNEEYVLIRTFYQLIDIIVLDYESLMNREKLICITLIYLLIGLFKNIFNRNEVAGSFPFGGFDFSNYSEYNFIFAKFLSNYVGIEYEEFIELIPYVSLFFKLRFDYSPPRVIVEENSEERQV